MGAAAPMSWWNASNAKVAWNDVEAVHRELSVELQRRAVNTIETETVVLILR